jgi:hypothetical protein
MSEIQRSTSPGPLSAADADLRLRHAPQWFRERVSAARELRGLMPLPVRKSARAAPPRRQPPAAGAASAATMPRSAVPTAPAAKLPMIALVLCGEGAAELAPGGLVETFMPGAFDAWLERTRKAGRGANFEIRVGGHGTAAIATAADGLEFRILASVGPVVLWQPDGENPRHRAAVELVRAGQDAISVEFHALRVELIDGCRVVHEAAPVGVALLRRGEAPAYSGAIAGVLPGINLNRELVQIAGRSLRRGRSA